MSDFSVLMEEMWRHAN